ncbi:hypothetical protein CDD83_7866 [Cordyceps sp. RAO-2017]|nr:hypothetical protein CDD83_7866 [Cordyceps sp. RAO-2017]
MRLEFLLARAAGLGLGPVVSTSSGGPTPAATATATATSASAAATPPPFDWDGLAPSRRLAWHDCYDGFRCARLRVPLDWRNASSHHDDGRTAALALIALPADVPDSHPEFGGSIIANPGGPGGSGVELLLRSGRRLRRIVDKPGRRRYQLVSFDPRGIGNSWPAADCFPGPDALARGALGYDMRGAGALDGSARAVPYMFGLNAALGRRCARAAADGLNGGDIFPYLGTASVARDMVEMVDRIDELRSGPTDGPGPATANGTRPAARLQYLGFSYGTILGNYFASLFPGRVGRMVLDGVADAVDYANGPGWTTNLADIDEIAARFYSGCHGAGPAACPLARPNDTSGADIRARVDAWLAALDQSPAAVADTPSGSVVALTAHDYLDVFLQCLYLPIPLFHRFAEALDASMAGNFTAFLPLLDATGVTPHLRDGCVRPDARPKAPVVRPESGSAVLCLDGDSLAGNDVAWWRRYLKTQLAQSPLFGANWSLIRFTCSAWPFRNSWPFKGPFTSPEPRPGAPGSPAAPLLFLSNRLDPVTPLRAARAMAAGHPRAGLVVQEAMGHCTLASASSPCTARIVADYFDSGRLPDRGTTCQVLCGPWDPGCTVSGLDNEISV